MALGKPVIASAAAGNLDLVAPGGDGLLVPPLDPAAWAAAIDRVLGDAALAHRFGAAGRHTARETFSARADGARTRSELYRAVLGRRRACPAAALGMRFSHLSSPRNGAARGQGVGVHHRQERDQARLSGRGQHPLAPAGVRRGRGQRRAARRTTRSTWSASIGDPQDPDRRDRVGHDPAQHGAGRTRPCAPCASAGIRGGSTSRPTRCCTSAAPRSWPRPSSGTTAIRGSKGCWCGISTSTAGSTPSPRTGAGTGARCARVRLDPALDIRPYQGAQGFRVGPEHRKIRARLTDAEMFHYGWARPAQALREKRELGKTMYPWRDADERKPLLAWVPGIRPFRGQHPAVAQAWIEPRRLDPDRVIAPRRFRLAVPALLCLRGDRAADRRPGVRVPELHARLTRVGRARTPGPPAAARGRRRRCGA